MKLPFPSKYLPFGLIAVGIGLFFYAVLGASDEDEIRERLSELAHAVEAKEGENIIFRTARLKDLFSDTLSPTAQLSVPELPSTTGSKELAMLAGQAIRFSPDLQVSLGAPEIKINGTEAHATSEVTLTGTRYGELTRDRRGVQFLLTKADGDWRIARIEVAAQEGQESSPQYP